MILNSYVVILITPICKISIILLPTTMFLIVVTIQVQSQILCFSYFMPVSKCRIIDCFSLCNHIIHLTSIRFSSAGDLVGWLKYNNKNYLFLDSYVLLHFLSFLTCV